ncbi:MAG TPA: ABC transporter ATP-binding protein [Vicinamibacterales bacterium]|jgi:lipopolysaccharide transport system ATP-binding protein
MNPVRVDRIGKRYQLGAAERPSPSFREAIVNAATTPFRRLERLRGRGEDGWFWALRDVSFDVAGGEVLAVIGRNGAGKSTLLKVLSRITEPSTGRIELRGRVASLLEVGTGFHPDLTGRENVFLNGAILGMKRDEIRRKFEAIVEFAELARFIDTPVKHYSSGMYMRLAFSVAAHLEGEILLVDEVLAVGDVAFQQKCLGKMQDVSRGGRTVLFISHNMTAVSALCSRAIVLDQGQTVFDGPVQQGVRFYLEHRLTDASLDWELDSRRRLDPDFGSLVRIERIAARASGNDGFRFMEPLRFRIEIAGRAAYEQVTCAIGLDDVYGTRVVTIDSADHRIRVGAGGRCAVEVTTPGFGLLPGKYLLSASVYSGAQYLDAIVHFGALTIVPLSVDGGAHVEEYDERGRIAVPSQWVVSPLPAEVPS